MSFQREGVSSQCGTISGLDGGEGKRRPKLVCLHSGPECGGGSSVSDVGQRLYNTY